MIGAGHLLQALVQSGASRHERAAEGQHGRAGPVAGGGGRAGCARVRCAPRLEPRLQAVLQEWTRNGGTADPDPRSLQKILLEKWHTLIAPTGDTRARSRKTTAPGWRTCSPGRSWT